MVENNIFLDIIKDIHPSGKAVRKHTHRVRIKRGVLEKRREEKRREEKRREEGGRGRGKERTREWSVQEGGGEVGRRGRRGRWGGGEVGRRGGGEEGRRGGGITLRMLSKEGPKLEVTVFM